MLNVLCWYVEFVVIVWLGWTSGSSGRGLDPVKQIV